MKLWGGWGITVTLNKLCKKRWLVKNTKFSIDPKLTSCYNALRTKNLCMINEPVQLLT